MLNNPANKPTWIDIAENNFNKQNTQKIEN